MKTKLLSCILVAVLFVAAGCVSPKTHYNNRKVNVLGGLLTAESAAFEKTGPLTIELKSSDINPGSNFDGDRVTLLWGLITIVDD